MSKNLVRSQLSFSVFSQSLRVLPPSGTLQSFVTEFLALNPSLSASPPVIGKNSFCFLPLVILCFLLISGCSKEPQSPSSFSPGNETKKINTLIDLDSDKKSDLIFWNTSTMSSPGKFLEPCFFEAALSGKKNYLRKNFGEVGDIPLLGYFDNDEIIDFALYRYGEYANNFIIETSSGNKYSLDVGSKSNLPVSNDYNGDGLYDAVVYSLKDNTFYGILSGSGNRFQFQLQDGGDIPVPKDYDGDGHCDFATYNTKDGNWLINLSRDNKISKKTFGGGDFLPIPQDYDGDGKADLCIWDHKTNEVKAILTTLNRPVLSDVTEKIKKALGKNTFLPVLLDYDGDNASELAFWNSSSKLVTAFDIKDDLKQKVYHFNKISGSSIPVSSFLLKKYLFKKELKNKQPENNSFISDFDGDYVLEKCVRSKETSTFLCKSSRTNLMFALPLGQKTDLPVIGNFNADNISDLGVYRQNNQSFYVRYLGKLAPKDIQIVKLSEKAKQYTIPMIDDYDMDYIDDFALYNLLTKKLFVKRSSDSTEVELNFEALKNNENDNSNN